MNLTECLFCQAMELNRKSEMLLVLVFGLGRQRAQCILFGGELLLKLCALDSVRKSLYEFMPGEVEAGNGP